MSKSHAITVGQSDAGPVKLEVPRLIVSRGLITADSGGGKSWLLRKVLEQVSKTTQTIVFDPEAEFATLRELRDMVLVGPDGEVPAQTHTAAVLCRRLMELNLSAVIDLSEIPAGPQRQAFVATFCDTLLNLPRALWHPCVIAIDEIHEFAPEGEKSKSEDAVATLSSKGRKRGFCLLGATQRLSRLSKNVASGLKNQFVGTFSQDTDQKRAAGMLGFGKERWPEIRDLSGPGHEGEFFCYGPAFNHRGVVKMRSGAVETTHPQAGVGRPAEPPAPSAKIKGVLAELKDIPQQAAAEVRDLAAAKSKIAELERQLRQQPKAPATVVSHATSKQDAAAIARLTKGLDEAMKALKAAETKLAELPEAAVDPEQVRAVVDATVGKIVAMFQQADARRKGQADQLRREVAKAVGGLQRIIGTTPTSSPAETHGESSKPPHTPRHTPPPSTSPQDPGDGSRKAVERAMLIAIAQHPEGLTKGQIVIYAGYRPSGGTSAAFARFRAEDWVRDDGGRLTLSPAGEAALGPYDPLPTGADLREKMIAEASPVEAALLKVIFDAYPNPIAKGEAVERAGYKASGGTSAAFALFRKLGWTVKADGGIKASDTLFD